MKNSSRLEAKIDKKFTRSNSCTSGSSASSSTRALKASQLSSRSRNLSGLMSPAGMSVGSNSGISILSWVAREAGTSPETKRSRPLAAAMFRFPLYSRFIQWSSELVLP